MIKKIKWSIIPLLFSLSSYATNGDDGRIRYRSYFFDALSFQMNIGYTSTDFNDRSNNVLLAGGQRNLNFSGNGLHGSLLFLDEIQLYQSWYIGARAGAQFWSNLSGDAAVPAAFAGYTSRYNYQKLFGGFVDITLDIELIEDRFDIYGFAGAGYNRYRLRGVNTLPSGSRIIFRNQREWLTSPRAGGGFSVTFNQIYLIGLEYTHMFHNTLNFSRSGRILALDNRNHQFSGSDDTIDLTIAVYMNP